MNMKIIEKEILNGAVQKFRENTGLTAEIIELEARAINADHIHDAIIKVKWKD